MKETIVMKNSQRSVASNSHRRAESRAAAFNGSVRVPPPPPPPPSYDPPRPTSTTATTATSMYGAESRAVVANGIATVPPALPLETAGSHARSPSSKTATATASTSKSMATNTLTTKRGLAKNRNKEGGKVIGFNADGSKKTTTLTVKHKRQPFPQAKFENYPHHHPHPLPAVATTTSLNQEDRDSGLERGRDVSNSSSIFQDDDSRSIFHDDDSTSIHSHRLSSSRATHRGADVEDPLAREDDSPTSTTATTATAIKLTTKRGLAKNRNTSGGKVAGTAKHRFKNDTSTKSATSTVRRERKPFPHEKFEHHHRRRDPQTIAVVAKPTLLDEADTVDHVKRGNGRAGVSSILQDDDYSSVSVGARSSYSVRTSSQNDADFEEDPLAMAEDTTKPNEQQDPLLEATLVTTANLELSSLGDIIIAEPAEKEKKEAWSRFIPNSIGGKLTCIAVVFCATALAVTGIVCGSGFCSSSDNRNDGLPSTGPQGPPATNAPSTILPTQTPTFPTTVLTHRTPTFATTRPTPTPTPTNAEEPANYYPSNIFALTTSPPTVPILQLPIYIKFMVETADFATINNSELALAWPIFVENIVAEVAQDHTSLKQRSAHRHLRVNLEPQASYIYDIIVQVDDYDFRYCDAYGTFSLLLTEDEDTSLVEQTYGTAMVDAINADKLFEVMHSVSPNTAIRIFGPAVIVPHPSTTSNTTISFLGKSISMDETSISLVGNLSEGYLPTEIGLLTGLANLHIAAFTLTGSMPVHIGLLTELRSLYVNNCQLYGIIPSEVGLLTLLTTLDFSNNQLSASVPSDLVELTHLTYLNLGYNGLSGGIPTMPYALQELYLGNNFLSGSIGNNLWYSPALRNIDLHVNQLTGSIDTKLGLLTALTSLDFSSNRLVGSIPTDLGVLTELVHLFLEGNQLTGTIASSICAVDGLEISVGAPITCPTGGCGASCRVLPGEVVVNTNIPTSSWPETNSPPSALPIPSSPTTSSPPTPPPATSPNTALPTAAGTAAFFHNNVTEFGTMIPTFSYENTTFENATASITIEYDDGPFP